MKNEDITKPKTVISSRGFYEDDLVEKIKNTSGFQMAVDYHKDNLVKDIKVTYDLTAEKPKDNIIINSEGITREIDNDNSDPHIREKINQDMKKKDKIKDVFPCNAYSYRE